jgi:hypothetical protein
MNANSPHSGYKPLYNPPNPSFCTTLLHPSLNVLAYGGSVVCILTFTASNGHKKMSAINSALALAPKYTTVLFMFGNILSPYMYLKIS